MQKTCFFLLERMVSRLYNCCPFAVTAPRHCQRQRFMSTRTAVAYGTDLPGGWPPMPPSPHPRVPRLLPAVVSAACGRAASELWCVSAAWTTCCLPAWYLPVCLPAGNGCAGGVRYCGWNQTRRTPESSIAVSSSSHEVRIWHQ
jgi:hypothetical protein